MYEGQRPPLVAYEGREGGDLRCGTSGERTSIFCRGIFLGCRRKNIFRLQGQKKSVSSVASKKRRKRSNNGPNRPKQHGAVFCCRQTFQSNHRLSLAPTFDLGGKMGQREKKAARKREYDVWLYCNGCAFSILHVKKKKSESFRQCAKRLESGAKAVGWKPSWFCPRCIRNGLRQRFR